METAILNGLLGIGAGLAIFGGSLGAGIGQGRAVAGALTAMSRNPELRGELQTSMFIGLGIVESAPIYGLLIGFTLISKMA